MSAFKNIVSIAYELGLQGNSWYDAKNYLRASSYSKIIKEDDLLPSGTIFTFYIEGLSEYESI